MSVADVLIVYQIKPNYIFQTDETSELLNITMYDLMMMDGPSLCSTKRIR